MTRSIQLHPFSVLVGLGIAVMAMVTMGQSADLQGTQNVAVVNPVQIAPHPRDMVLIGQGVPYTVPVGKILSVTAFGSAEPVGNTSKLIVDGQVRVTAFDASSSGNGTTMKQLPGPGLRVDSGSIVDATNGSTGTPAIAWGYLVDA